MKNAPKLVFLLGLLALVVLMASVATASFPEFRHPKKIHPQFKTLQHALDTPSSTRDRSSNDDRHDRRDINPIRQLLHATKAEDGTITCNSSPKSVFTDGQFAELSLKYTPVCDYWRSIASAGHTSAEKPADSHAVDEKDELFKSLFTNTVSYTICEADSDDHHADHDQTHTQTLPNQPTPTPAPAPDQATARHDETQPIPTAPPVSAPESNVRPTTPTEVPLKSDTDHHRKHGDKDDEHSLRIHFAFTSNDLDADLPRHDREMEALVRELSRRHGVHLDMKREILYSKDDVRCQREHFESILNEVCEHDKRTAQEKLNIIYNEQLQDRIDKLTAAQKRFQSEVLTDDSRRIENRGNRGLQPISEPSDEKHNTSTASSTPPVTPPPTPTNTNTPINRGQARFGSWRRNPGY